ncbi:hypothetical protein [Aquitalea magnusonii]|uniref:Transmembrane protein n=1 Tax=Aquitalea magnusonii TaxID=332411 RepID=A0A318JMG9_9NEIS|nr:hypothetical protein [Aquitalea magnusonii]PXX51130.1 hypothetical protein DFR38_101191 [Aquitalea magnusonii]
MEALEKQEEMVVDDDLASPQDYLSGLLCLQGFLRHVRKTTKPYRVLQAWLDYEIQRISEGHNTSQYDAENLRACFGETGDKTASAWMASTWKVLNDFEAAHGEGLRSWAAQHGYSGFCLPSKLVSPGGAGNTSKFFFRFIAVTQKQTASSQSEALTPDTPVQYIMDTQIQPAWWIGWLLKSGYRLYGWRKWLFFIYFMTILIGVVIYVFTVLISAVYSHYFFNNSTEFIVSAITIGVCGWLFLSPIVRLFNWRITMAPALLTAYKEIDDTQLELMSLPHDKNGAKKAIRLVRYSAVCPICLGKISLRSGGRRYPGRLVGRCEEVPAEHVFSFDRMRKIGVLLH